MTEDGSRLTLSVKKKKAYIPSPSSSATTVTRPISTTHACSAESHLLDQMQVNATADHIDKELRRPSCPS